MRGLAITAVSAVIVAHWKGEVWTLARVTIGAGLLAGSAYTILTFLWNLMIAERLDDPPRTLSPREQRKLANQIRPFCNPPCHVTIYTFGRVKDGVELGESLREALRTVRWTANIDVGGAIPDPEQRLGIWVFGGYSEESSPPRIEILSDALRSVGLKTHLISEPTRERRLCIMIGKREY